MVGLSPLATAHPRLFQQAWVRPSSACYRTFSLAMARSPGFGSNPCNYPPVRRQEWRPFKTRFRSASAYRLKLAAPINSLTHYTRGTPSPHPHHKCCHSRALEAPTACRHPVSGLFHSPLGVLFTFPSRYLFAIGHQGVFRLGGWSPHVQTGFHVSRLTQGSQNIDAYGAITRYGRTFQTVLLTSY